MQHLAANAGSAALALLFGLAAAQDGPQPRVTRESRMEALAGAARSETVFLDRAGDGNLWARGVSYKARFGPEGAQYIPSLGSRAPRNFPLDLTFLSASIGGNLLADAAPAAPSVEGRRVTYDRGGVLEIFDLRPREVEHLFVIPSSEGAGDLVVRVGISSEMEFAGESAEGLRFEAPEDLGGVVYGHAVAIDRLGGRTGIPLRYEAGAAEIRLAGAALEGAVFPLTIDPAVHTFGVNTTGLDDFSAGAAYDWTNDEWAVVYEETFSGSDHDIGWTRVSDSVPPTVTFAGYVDYTGDDWRNPAIGNSLAGEGFLVVAQREAAGGALDWDIWGRLLDAGSSTFVSGQFAIAAAAAVNEANPDVGGNEDLTQAIYLVVWEHQGAPGNLDVYCRTVDHAAVPILGTANAITASGGNEHDPAVSTARGLVNWGPLSLWGVVFVRDYALPDRDVFFRQVFSDGTLGPGPTNLDSSLAEDEAPDVAGDSRRLLVVWQRNFGAHHDVLGRRVDATMFTNSLVSPTTNLTALAAPGFLLQDQIRPSVDAKGWGWTYACAEQFQTSLTDYDIYAAIVYGDAALFVPTGGGHVALAASGAREDRPRISTQALTIPPDDQGSMAVWDRVANAGTGERDVHAALLGWGSVSTVPSSCGSPAPGISFVGAQSLGMDFTVQSTMAQGGSPLLLIGVPGWLPLCGGTGPCALGVWPIFDFVPAAGLVIGVPGDPTLLGATAAFQVAEIGPPGGAGGCAFGPVRVLLSNTLNATVE